jgi:hypothetical protein
VLSHSILVHTSLSAFALDSAMILLPLLLFFLFAFVWPTDYELNRKRFRILMNSSSIYISRREISSYVIRLALFINKWDVMTTRN